MNDSAPNSNAIGLQVFCHNLLPFFKTTHAGTWEVTDRTMRRWRERLAEHGRRLGRSEKRQAEWEAASAGPSPAASFPGVVTCDKFIVQRGQFCANSLDALQ